MSEKSRCSYDRSLRADAKASGRGLITISITHANGQREEFQTTGNASDCRFVKWCGVMLTCAEARPLPDLEEFVRKHVESGAPFLSSG